jgi:hypothetical protein
MGGEKNRGAPQKQTKKPKKAVLAQAARKQVEKAAQSATPS